MYSAEDVQKIVSEKLEGYKFVLVSNREPYIHMHTAEGVRCKTPAGGLTAALDPLMQACGGTWVAGGSGDADRENVDKQNRTRVPPGKPKYTLKRVWMSKDEVDKYYFGFSNQTLWPLCHNVFETPVYDKLFWNGYKQSNKLFANAVVEEIKNENAFIWFQDYHLPLAPEMVKKATNRRRGKVVSAHFWHIPWPPFPVFRTCPWAKEILEGMLANNLIGFHLKEHCINFLSCVEKILELPVDYKKLAVAHEERRIFVKNFPISIDFDVVDNLAKKPGVKKEMKKARSPNKIPYKYIGVGVDRIDYTKGIIERFKAIDRFLEKYPQYQNNFVFVEAGAPSRTRISSYAALNDEIEKLAEEINWKYQMGYWRPIKYIQGKLGYNELLGLYRTADVCIVSSLHDGMNLVAKEFIAANVDRTGVLLLSRFAGAADELKSAVIVNPFDIEGFADAIHESLKMSVNEKKKRMNLLRNSVKENNIYKWVYDFISEAGRVMKE